MSMVYFYVILLFYGEAMMTVNVDPWAWEDLGGTNILIYFFFFGRLFLGFLLGRLFLGFLLGRFLGFFLGRLFLGLFLGHLFLGFFLGGFFLLKSGRKGE